MAPVQTNTSAPAEQDGLVRAWCPRGPAPALPMNRWALEGLVPTWTSTSAPDEQVGT